MLGTDLADNYQKTYREFFGKEPPPIRRMDSGGYRIRFSDGGKSYSNRELRCVIAMMEALKTND